MQMYTVDKIEGNSRLGAPVFSYHGRMANAMSVFFQEPYEEKMRKLEAQRVFTPLQLEIIRHRQLAESMPLQRKQILETIRQLTELQHQSDEKQQEILARLQERRDKEAYIPPQVLARGKRRDRQSVPCVGHYTPKYDLL